MELRTYTGLWAVERRLYKLQDITLPVPISGRQFVTFVVAVVPWFTLMNLIGVPFAPPFGHLLWLAPPALAVWAGNRPLAEGKTMVELITSQVRYWFNPRHYAALTPSKVATPQRVHLVARAWSRRRT